jgi:RNA 2',3'-cyclic 3'-phosphodiesterase
MRAFVAIELNDACRAALEAAVTQLRERVHGVRWVRSASLHLTLSFIGDLAEVDVPDVIASLSDVAAPCFTMRVAGVSGFPERGALRVIHAGVRDDDAVLVPLHTAVEAALGAAPQGRRFVPHITLGRVRKRDGAPTAQDLACETLFGRVDVESFVLMRSRPRLDGARPGGAVYDVVHRFPLAGTQRT